MHYNHQYRCLYVSNAIRQEDDLFMVEYVEFFLMYDINGTPQNHSVLLHHEIK